MIWYQASDTCLIPKFQCIFIFRGEGTFTVISLRRLQAFMYEGRASDAAVVRPSAFYIYYYYKLRWLYGESEKVCFRYKGYYNRGNTWGRSIKNQKVKNISEM